MSLNGFSRTGKRQRFVGMVTLMATTALATVAPQAVSFAQSSSTAQFITKAFNIPAQPVAEALIAFGQQAGMQASTDVSVVRNIQSNPVKGSMSWQSAIAAMLNGTGLTYRQDGSMISVIALPSDGAGTLPPVQVQGHQAGGAQTPYGPGVGYVATRSETGTKTNTPLIEVPQTISVVTRKQMTDQNVQSVAQALRYTSGVVPEQRGANTDSLEYLYDRGFQIDEYLNGLRLPSQLEGYNMTSFDPYLLDRIELLQGPASVLYGQASPGGILNLDSKRPTEQPIHEIMLQTGTYGRAQGSIDLSGKLNDSGTLLGRITADSFSTGTQVNGVFEQRVAVAPSLTWKPDADTSLTLFANYQYDPEAGYYNFVPAQGTILPGYNLSRSFNSGDPSYDQFSKTEVSIGYSFAHQFNSVWSVHSDFRYLYNWQSIHTLEPLSIIDNGTEMTREAYYNDGTVGSATLDNHAEAKFLTGPLRHTVTFGVDWQRTEFDHTFYAGAGPNLNLVNPVYNQTVAEPTTMLATSADQLLSQEGLYAQDQVRLGRWAFLAGVREDFTSEYTHLLTSGADTRTNDAAFTWRTGLVYLFDNGFAPYVSYSTSFQPTTGTSYSGAAFKPTTGQQYEAGVKYQPPGWNSFITASVFNLTEQNVLTTDPNHTSFEVQTGEVRSRGFELEGHANLTDNLHVIASYTYTGLKNTQSTTTSLGKVPVGIPANMFSAWVDDDLPWHWSRGLELGGGVRYIGSTWADTANTYKVPGVTLFDLAAHYDLGRAFPDLPKFQGLSLGLTASNLFNRSYLAYCSSGSCVYGAGRVVLGSLKYRW